jgi:hypothetical protein
MRALIRVVAALELALILPAGLFLSAVLVGAGDRTQYELTRLAQRIVAWYSARMWTLWILLLALPLTALVTGGGTLLRGWNVGAGPTMLVIAATTLAAAGILVIVVLHMLAN